MDPWYLHIDWAVVGATLFGPVVAVWLTLWSQSRFLRKQDRRALFTVMMRNRRHILNADFVGALNLVPIHFHSDKKVIERYSKLMATVSDTNWENPKSVPVLNEQVDTNVAFLLHEMSKAVGTPIEQLDILRGAYAPQGWKDKENSQTAMQEAVMALLSGRRPLYVVPITSEQSEPPPATRVSDGKQSTPTTETSDVNISIPVHDEAPAKLPE